MTQITLKLFSLYWAGREKLGGLEIIHIIQITSVLHLPLIQSTPVPLTFRKKRHNLHLIEENHDPDEKCLAFEGFPTMGFFLRLIVLGVCSKVW